MPLNHNAVGWQKVICWGRGQWFVLSIMCEKHTAAPTGVAVGEPGAEARESAASKKGGQTTVRALGCIWCAAQKRIYTTNCTLKIGSAECP